MMSNYTLWNMDSLEVTVYRDVISMFLISLLSDGTYALVAYIGVAFTTGLHPQTIPSTKWVSITVEM